MGHNADSQLDGEVAQDEAEVDRWTCPDCGEEWASIDDKVPGGCMSCVDVLRYLEYEAPGMGMVENTVSEVVCLNDNCDERVTVDPDTYHPLDADAVDVESEEWDMEAGEPTGYTQVEIYCSTECRNEQYTTDPELVTDGGRRLGDEICQ